MPNHSVSQAYCCQDSGPTPGSNNQVAVIMSCGGSSKEAPTQHKHALAVGASCWELNMPAVCSPAAVAEWRLGVQQGKQLPGALHGYRRSYTSTSDPFSSVALATHCQCHREAPNVAHHAVPTPYCCHCCTRTCTKYPGLTMLVCTCKRSVRF
jgi:hypothetical protein